MELQTAKILITGGRASGKTTLMHSVSDIGVITGELNMSFGQVTVSDVVTLYLYSVLEVFAFDENMFNVLSNQLGLDENFYGVIQIVDSTDPDSFESSAELLKQMQTMSQIPHVVVAANRYNEPGAASVDAIRAALNVPQDVPVVGCVVAEKESAKSIVRHLLYAVIAKLVEQDLQTKSPPLQQ